MYILQMTALIYYKRPKNYYDLAAPEADAKNATVGAKGAEEGGDRRLAHLLSKTSFSNYSQVFSDSMAVLSIILMVFVEVVMVLILFASKAKLKTREIRRNYKVLISSTKIENRWQKVYHLIYVNRRIMHCLLAAYCSEYGAIQIVVFVSTNVMVTAYMLAIQPLDERARNHFECMCEVVLLFFSYSLFILTDYLKDADLQFYLAGNWYMASIFATIVCSFLIVIKAPIRKGFLVYVKYRNRLTDCLEKRRKRLLEARVIQLPRLKKRCYKQFTTTSAVRQQKWVSHAEKRRLA